MIKTQNKSVTERAPSHETTARLAGELSERYGGTQRRAPEESLPAEVKLAAQRRRKEAQAPGDN